MGTSASCSRSSATRLTRRNRRVRPLDDDGDEIVLSTAVAGSKRSLANFSTSPRLSFARIATMVPTGIDERWQFVEMTCNREKRYTIDHTRDWKTVRLFVSSTFSDFQSEREVLANQVFPELHEWCEARRLHFLATDLHWGLDKEPRTKESLEASLREIERCREDDSGGFFFLSLLSELVGWIPTVNDVSGGIAANYGWIHGLSMQELEIINAAYRDKNPNVGFFVRDPSSLIGLPTDARSQFVDQTSEAKARRDVLLTKLKSKFPNQIKQYKCWILKDESYAMGQIKLQGLEPFAHLVTEHFKERISKQFPIKTASPWRSINVPDVCTEESLVAAAWKAHESAIGDSSNGAAEQPCFGHGYLEKQVMSYVNGKGAGTPLLISGNAGEGKSSVIGHCIRHLQRQDEASATVSFMSRPSCKIFYHFVGAVPGSRNLRQLLWRLWHFEPLGFADSLPTDVNVLTREIGLMLSRCGTEKVVLFFSQLDLLENGQNAHALKWLPAKLPDSLKVVITLSSDSTTAKILRNRKPAPVELVSTRQDKSLGLDVIQSILRHHNLWLSEDHLRVLSEKHGSNNLMYVNEACKEMLQYPNEETEAVVLGLPQDLNGLMDKMLIDCVTCHGGRLIIAALCLMVCSRNGLLETELLDMLGALSTASTTSRTVSEVEGQCLGQQGLVPFITGGIIPFMDWNRSQYWDGDNVNSQLAIDAEIQSIVAEETGPAAAAATTTDRDGADSGIIANSSSESRKISGLGPEINRAALALPRAERRSSGSSCGSRGRVWDSSRRGSYSGGQGGLNSSSSSLGYHPPARRSSLNGLSQLSFTEQTSNGDVSSLSSFDRQPHRLRYRRQSIFSGHPPPSPRLFAAQWSHVNVGLRQLFADFGHSGEGRLNFAHQAMRDAAVRLYFRCASTSSFPFSFCTSSTFYGAGEVNVPASDFLRGGGVESNRLSPFRPPSSTVLNSDGGGGGGGGETSSLSRLHDAVESEVERQRFLWWHARLAGYFDQSTDHARRAEELPYHLLKIGDRAKLAKCLTEWPVFDYLCTDENVMDLLHYWREAGGSKAAAVRYNEALENLVASSDASEEEVALRRERVAYLLSKMNERDEGRKLLNEALEAEEQQLGCRHNRIADLTLAIATFLNDSLKEIDQLTMESDRIVETRCEIVAHARRSADVRKTLLELRGDKMEPSERKQHRLSLAQALSLLSFHQTAIALDQCGETALNNARAITQECVDLYGQLGCLSRQIESLLSLAVTYNSSPRQMLECFEEALRLCTRSYGPRHEMAARIHLSIALLYDCRLERPGAALTHYKRWFVTNELVLGADHPKTIQSRNTVTEHLMRMGKEKEAKKLQLKKGTI